MNGLVWKSENHFNSIFIEEYLKFDLKSSETESIVRSRIIVILLIPIFRGIEDRLLIF